MIDWLIAANEKCRDLADKARDSLAALEKKDADGAKRIQEYMKGDYKALIRLWDEVDPEKKQAGRLSDLARHITFGMEQDFKDILKMDLPDVQRSIEKLAKAAQHEIKPIGFEDMLHPAIVASSLSQYKGGHLRDAVLNGVVAVFDMIRSRTGLDLDGSNLVGQAFGMANGKLIFSDVVSDSGRNDQKGFMQIYEGIYTGVRNVKAHSLAHDLNEVKAAQYLVMLSLLARRVEECNDR
jgi:uncharacterized protein (TIGR02391 family)